MKNPTLNFRLASAIAAALAVAACSPEAGAVKINEAAPTFTLPNSNGKDVNLADLKGKIVVLEWYNEGCPYVKKHYESGNIPKLHTAYPAKDVAWLTILSSAEGKQGYATGPEANALMKKANAAPTHVLLDPSGKVGKLYGAKTTPHMYVIDKDGLLRYQGAIDSIPTADQGDIAKADNYVVTAVDAVLAGKSVAKPVTKAYGCGVKYAKN